MWVDNWVHLIVCQDIFVETIHLLSQVTMILVFLFPIGNYALTQSPGVKIVVTGAFILCCSFKVDS